MVVFHSNMRTLERYNVCTVQLLLLHEENINIHRYTIFLVLKYTTTVFQTFSFQRLLRILLQR
jgi:hypothetical protein